MLNQGRLRLVGVTIAGVHRLKVEYERKWIKPFQECVDEEENSIVNGGCEAVLFEMPRRRSVGAFWPVTGYGFVRTLRWRGIRRRGRRPARESLQGRWG